MIKVGFNQYWSFTLFFMLHLSVVAQKVAVDGVDKGTYYVTLGGAGATNRWADYFKGFKTHNQFSGEIGCLLNPTYKKGENAPVFVGAEIGYLGLGTDPVESVVLGNFLQQHQLFWFHGSARYRPIVWASKWNPFIDVSGGTTVYNSNVQENLSETIVRLESIFASAFSYKAGVGIGYIVPRKAGGSSYVDLSISTFQTEPIRTAAREGASISGLGSIEITRKRIPISYVRVTLSLSSFW